MEKLIITIAPTGNVPTKESNPNTPVTPDEIVEDIKKCVELGASVAHIHVRDEDNMPTSKRDIYQEVLEKLDRENVNVISQVSTGARGGENTVEWRGQMLDLDKAQMASLATGSSNFLSSVNANSPDLVTALALKMKENNLKPEIECFDMAMIDNAIFLSNKDILKKPLHFSMVMNVPGSIKGTPENLLYMVNKIPKGSTWSVCAIGSSQFDLIPIAIALGGNVRTGLEDVSEFPKGHKVSNPELVKRCVEIAQSIGREIATPEEAAQILGLYR